VKVLVGSGAYKLDSAYQGDGGPLLFTANDQYYLGTPFVKRIEMTNADDQFAALLGGTVDSASGSGLRNETLAPFKKDSAYGVVTTRGASTTALYFNLKKGGPLADVQVRRACAMAIDRKDLVARLAGGNGQPGNPGFLGPENPFLSPVKQYDLDVAGANALLDGAGYKRAANGTRQTPNGAPLSFDLLIGTPDTPLGELVTAALKQIGVQANIKTLQPGPQLFGAKFSGGFDMAVVGFPGPSAGGPNGDPDLLRAVFSSKAPPSLTGAYGYANPAFDDLAEKQRATFDQAQRKSIVAQMQGILADDLPVLQLYSPDDTFVYRKAVLDPWYVSPGRYPVDVDNKQNFITGEKFGTKVRPIR
jgi:peptide/nickel transport system substrate-binding protein